MLESRNPSRLSVPAHVHDGEDETLYLLAGELRGLCGDEHWTAGQDSFVFVPLDRPYAASTSQCPATN